FPIPCLISTMWAMCCSRVQDSGMAALPSLDTAWSAFQTLGHRPEEFLRALAQLQASSTASGLSPDQLLPVIAATLRSSAADLELQKVEQIGGLAIAISDRVAQADGPARGLFSAEAGAAYGEVIGREVRVDEIQPVVNELLAANVLMRLGHGLYGVSDPFVQEIWRERKR
ncbi:ATP-binding protein, partial [Synechococcus sp. CS-1328]|nr:ATP-binding protein [Synechococcus sp. CS-1328]